MDSLPEAEFRPLLEWAAPRLGLRAGAFRRVGHQVRKRVLRRIRALGLPSVAAYRQRLEAEPQELEHFEQLCHVSISRLWRDAPVFDALTADWLPPYALRAQGQRRPLRIWSTGCASGEEPTSILLAVRLGLPAQLSEVALELWGTDADAALLARARTGCFAAGAFRELPDGWRERAFEASDEEEDTLCLRPGLQGETRYVRQDVRHESPGGLFDVVFCRNQAFSYFTREMQTQVLSRLRSALWPRGLLVVGKDERLPEGSWGFVQPVPGLPLWQRTG